MEVTRSGLVGEVALTIDEQRDAAFYIVDGTSLEARMRSAIMGYQILHL